MEDKTKIDWNDIERYAEENNLMRIPLDKLLKKYLADDKRRKKQQEIKEEE